MARVYLGLGANQGDREAAFAHALRHLQARGLEGARPSSLYLTEPVGGPPQDWFSNTVVEGTTRQSPEALLAACLEAEQALGRVRSVKDGPRTLDVDILFYGDLVRAAPDPVLPHPRLHLRRFVLVPLVELAPDLVHPRLRRTMADLLAHCPDTSVVRKATPAGTPA
jgi:2-amino-4-hydroxy-6-hydroxymethyldihydropteridine diphosphokinase